MSDLLAIHISCHRAALRYIERPVHEGPLAYTQCQIIVANVICSMSTFLMLLPLWRSSVVLL